MFILHYTQFKLIKAHSLSISGGSAYSPTQRLHQERTTPRLTKENRATWRLPVAICSGNRFHRKGNWQFSIQLSSRAETQAFCTTMAQQQPFPLTIVNTHRRRNASISWNKPIASFNYRERRAHLLCHTHLFRDTTRVSFFTLDALSVQ